MADSDRLSPVHDVRRRSGGFDRRTTPHLFELASSAAVNRNRTETDRGESCKAHTVNKYSGSIVPTPL
jgi:hypothetical protein